MNRIVGRRHRLAIYGGTFAPPHIGHLHAAQMFLREENPDTLLIMPAAVPPHKQIDHSDDPQIRLAMCRAAFEGVDSRLRVSDYEISRGGASYTWQTLTHFMQTTDSELIFLCGTDMFLSMDRWRCPEIIFALAEIACVMRVNDAQASCAVRSKAEEYAAKFSARTKLIACEAVELSSSEIRRRIRLGADVGELVPRGAAEIITARGLYRM